MEAFGLILGHLFGDYILQNDWMAKWKTASQGSIDHAKGECVHFLWASCRPPVVCSFHCLVYTSAVAVFSFWWMPWWGLLVCFLLHWPVDRFRLALWWMRNVSGQQVFATGVLSPWSIILVDNIFHLLTLYGILVVVEGLGW